MCRCGSPVTRGYLGRRHSAGVPVLLPLQPGRRGRLGRVLHRARVLQADPQQRRLAHQPRQQRLQGNLQPSVRPEPVMCQSHPAVWWRPALIIVFARASFHQPKLLQKWGWLPQKWSNHSKIWRHVHPFHQPEKPTTRRMWSNSIFNIMKLSW